MPSATDYLIVGGGLAGGYAAASIRKKDESGRVVILTKENQIPYDRVPLSKAYLMGSVQRERLFFKKQDFYSENKIELVLGHEAKELDAQARTVKLDDGSVLRFRKLLLATGGYPRKAPIEGSDLSGIYYLRTIDDCEKLKELMLQSHSVAVIGGGFIGCELACAFATKGLQTTIVEMGAYLLNMAIDEESGRWLGQYYEKMGVRVLVNASASRFSGENGHVRTIELKDGRTISADFVVVGIGIALNTDLAQRAGLAVDRGIIVNEYLETKVEGIYAAGDVARFYSPLFNRHLRLEHYDIAVKHGMTAGVNMAGERKAFNEIPYFFSYQFDLKIYAHGDLSQKTIIIRRGNLDKDKGFMQFYFNQNTLDAVLSFNKRLEEVKKAKELVLERKSFSDPMSLADESKTL